MPQAQQAQSVPLPKRWPLVSRFQSRGSSPVLTKDARLINCYAEYDAEDREYWIYKRLGTNPTAFTTSTHLQGCGIYTYMPSNYLLFVFKDAGSSNGYLYLSGIASPLATMTMPTLNPATPVWFETINSSPQVVIVGTGVQAWVFNVATFAATQITDPNFPAITVPGMVNLDGTLYVMDPYGTIWGSASPNNPLVWSGTNNIVAGSNADLGVALAKQLNYLIALKQYTTQVFYDNGPIVAGGTPLAAVPDSQIPLGCASGNSVQSIDNSLLWMTSNQYGSPQIVQMDNLTPKIVSTPAVERILDEASYHPGFAPTGLVYAAANSLWSWVLKHAGHRLYGIDLPLNNLTLVYDLDQQLWQFWQNYNGNSWQITGIASLGPLTSVNSLHLGINANDGTIRQIDDCFNFPTDFGNVYPVDIYTPNMDFGTNRRKYLNAMYINADKVPSSLSVRHSDDDYTTWSNFRKVDLSTKKPRISNEGTFHRRRAYHFRHAAPTPLRIKSIDLQMDVGTL